MQRGRVTERGEAAISDLVVGEVQRAQADEVWRGRQLARAIGAHPVAADVEPADVTHRGDARERG